MLHVVFITTKDSAEAERIAKQLVDEKLAACVNVLPKISSTYRWKGKVVHASEALLLVKTSDEKLDGLIARVKELHSYEIPEILALPIERGSREYLKWLEESLR
jgi:periplasmic divalent cation tolerance protein